MTNLRSERFLEGDHLRLVVAAAALEEAVAVPLDAGDARLGHRQAEEAEESPEGAGEVGLDVLVVHDQNLRQASFALAQQAAREIARFGPTLLGELCFVQWSSMLNHLPA